MNKKRTKIIINAQPEKPQLAVDIVIFTVTNNILKILLIKRGVKPFKNMWAIPGGRVNKDESLERAAQRELREETGVHNVYLEQLYTFGDPNRDPRGRVISVAYFALTNKKFILRSATDAADANWFPINKLPKLAFDHKKIIQYARKRLQWKLEYTNIAYGLLPKLFTISNLQKIYEVILGKKLDKRNFQKKIFSLNLIQSANQYKKDVKYRPPLLYRFKKRQPIIFTKREVVF